MGLYGRPYKDPENTANVLDLIIFGSGLTFVRGSSQRLQVVLFWKGVLDRVGSEWVRRVIDGERKRGGDHTSTKPPDASLRCSDDFITSRVSVKRHHQEIHIRSTETVNDVELTPFV